MTYFGEKYPDLRYPIEAVGQVGLRNAQIGSIHAIASHFTLERHQPGVVVLPTGSGKTAVLMATPYLMRSERALVLTPSRWHAGMFMPPGAYDAEATRAQAS